VYKDGWCPSSHDLVWYLAQWVGKVVIEGAHNIFQVVSETDRSSVGKSYSVWC